MAGPPAGKTRVLRQMTCSDVQWDFMCRDPCKHVWEKEGVCVECTQSTQCTHPIWFPGSVVLRQRTDPKFFELSVIKPRP